MWSNPLPKLLGGEVLQKLVTAIWKNGCRQSARWSQTKFSETGVQN
jgi:hypothetical protein